MSGLPSSAAGQQTVLAVNQLYIESAAMADDYRTEPPFKLQGSYRNMAKLAEKVVAIMEDDEVTELLLDHYAGESQTLTTEAEANLLRFKLLLQVASAEDADRWSAITSIYRRKQEMSGAEDDPVQLAVRQLIRLNEEVGGIATGVSTGMKELLAPMSEIMSRPQSAPSVHLNLDPLIQAVNGLTQIQRERQEQEQENTAAQTASSSAEMASANGQPKVEIINTLPKYYGRLYQHHIDVLEKKLNPCGKCDRSAFGSRAGNTQASE